ncbi:hypothetical protein GCM10023094_10870 [Rhodococcus olei]|uniref:Polyketide cyclase/dehydrase/lipid transport protein n=2 Tax=Rhodococcus olei TaxID=2161675 RepID=A0ABP8NY68_9NOCA
MWEYEFAIDTDAPRADIWRLWADVERWGDWNDGVEAIEHTGPFARGGTIEMTPPGEDVVHLELVEVIDGEMFADQARFGDLVLRTDHRMIPLADGRTRVVYRMVITGPGADEVGPRIGPGITADWPETVAALVEHAGRP